MEPLHYFINIILLFTSTSQGDNGLIKCNIISLILMYVNRKVPLAGSDRSRSPKKNLNEYQRITHLPYPGLYPLDVKDMP